MRGILEACHPRLTSAAAGGRRLQSAVGMMKSGKDRVEEFVRQLAELPQDSVHEKKVKVLVKLLETNLGLVQCKRDAAISLRAMAHWIVWAGKCDENYAEFAKDRFEQVIGLDDMSSAWLALVVHVNTGAIKEESVQHLLKRLQRALPPPAPAGFVTMKNAISAEDLVQEMSMLHKAKGLQM